MFKIPTTSVFGLIFDNNYCICNQYTEYVNYLGWLPTVASLNESHWGEYSTKSSSDLLLSGHPWQDILLVEQIYCLGSCIVAYRSKQ